MWNAKYWNPWYWARYWSKAGGGDVAGDRQPDYRPGMYSAPETRYAAVPQSETRLPITQSGSDYRPHLD